MRSLSLLIVPILAAATPSSFAAPLPAPPPGARVIATGAIGAGDTVKAAP